MCRYWTESYAKPSAEGAPVSFLSFTPGVLLCYMRPG